MNRTVILKESAVTDTELERVVYREPFTPFVLRLEDGEEVTVARPRKALVSGGYIAAFGVSQARGGVARHGLRLIRSDRIVAIETLANENGIGGAEGAVS
jgi:hypothetical protein